MNIYIYIFISTNVFPIQSAMASVSSGATHTTGRSTAHGSTSRVSVPTSPRVLIEDVFAEETGQILLKSVSSRVIGTAPHRCLMLKVSSSNTGGR